MSCAAFSSPWSRSPWAPWIATLPKIAIAPVAAIATARAPAAPSSIVAMCGTTPVISRASRPTSASVRSSTKGSTSSSAATSRTMPGIAASGAASRIAVAASRHTTPTSAARAAV